MAQRPKMLIPSFPMNVLRDEVHTLIRVVTHPCIPAPGMSLCFSPIHLFIPYDLHILIPSSHNPIMDSPEVKG